MYASDSGSGAAEDLTFFTGTASTVVEAIRITAEGNVGIGTTVPSDKLTIGGVNANNNADQNAIRFIDTNNNLLGKILSRRGSDGNKGSLTFSAGNSNVASIYLDETGNVGIGTATPAAKLHVDDSTAVSVVRLGGTPNVGPHRLEGQDQYHQILLRGTPTNATTGYLMGNVTSFTEYGGEFRWYKKNGTTLAEQMRITSDGYIVNN